MANRFKNVLSLLLCLCMLGALLPTTAYAAEGGTVHVYAPTGDDPDTPENESPDVASDKYQVVVNGTTVPAIKYNAKNHAMDIARFASDDRTPTFSVTLKTSESINSVQVYPVRYYPQDAIEVSADKKTVTFQMSDQLNYAILYINGSVADQQGKPYLALINDPLENPANIPDKNAANVLNFKTFAQEYLAENPITDTVGEECRPAGQEKDYSNNDSTLYTLNYPAGKYVAYNSREVAFPNMRARQKNDVSEALQAALETIKNNPELDTLYIPNGYYHWSGLQIIDWNSKPLTIYSEEGALMKNRLGECRESIEPAIYFKNSSNITVSGRGVYDGQGWINSDTDTKHARLSPHQGGSMLIHSQNITFNDTYVRDAKQWNWECHTVEDVTYNNIKGLSPYDHSWVDGLDLTSGVNVTVNGAITLGYDDCFASGHYNPSDGFPMGMIERNEFTETIGAAAAVYNKDRLEWDTKDSENIVVNNTLSWTLNWANSIRTGHNTYGHKTKSYTFNNFNAVNAPGNIRIQNGNYGTYPGYESITIINSSFDFSGSAALYAEIPMNNGGGLVIKDVVVENNWFNVPVVAARLSGITNLTVRQNYINGEHAKTFAASGMNITNVTNLVTDMADNTPPVFAKANEITAEEGQLVEFTVSATDADNDTLTYSVKEGTLPRGASFNSTTGKFTWTPGAGQYGWYAVTFQVTDGYNTASLPVTISVESDNMIKLAGTPFGRTESTWETQAGINNVFDGRATTFYDGQGGSYVGLRLDAAYTLLGVRGMPRAGYTGRMIGTQIQGSNDGTNWDTLHTISSLLENPQYTVIWFPEDERPATAYSQYRLYSAGAGFCNVAELEFYGYAGTEPLPVNKTALQELYDEYKDMEQGDYTDESWAVFVAAMTAAENMLADEEAVQEDVNDALTALQRAFDALTDGVERTIVDLFSTADASVSTWNANEQGRNYGANEYLRTMRMGNSLSNLNGYGYFGELYTGNGGSGNDGKVGFLQFDVSEYRDRIDQATLTLTLHGRTRDTYTGDDTIMVTRMPASFVEGDGSSTTNPYTPSTIEGAISWANKPAFNTLTGTVKESNAFPVDGKGRILMDTSYSVNHSVDGTKVTVDISELIKEMPEDEDVLSLAFCETVGYDLAFVSREGALRNVNADESMQPTLTLAVATESVVDTTELQELYDTVKDTPEASYTTGTWTAFKSALAAAAGILADPEGSTQAQVDAATDALRAAYDALALRGNHLADLQVALILAGTHTESNYTADSWAAFAQARTNAQNVYDNAANATQDQIDEALAALDAAATALVTKSSEAFKEVLKAAIETAEAMLATPDSLTPGSVSKLEAALETAKAALTSNDETALKNAADALLDAIEEAANKGDKTALAALVAAIRARDLSGFTEESVATLNNVLGVADGVLADPEAQQDHVDYAMAKLLDALGALVPKIVLNYTGLDYIIARAESILENADKYVSTSIAGLPDALASAKTVRAEATTQAAIDAATGTLTTEVGKARLKADLSALIALLDAATAKLNNAELYTAASVANLKSAVARAQSVVNKNDIDADAMQVELSALNKAINALKLKPTENPGGGTPGGGSDVNTPTPTAPAPAAGGGTAGGGATARPGTAADDNVAAPDGANAAAPEAQAPADADAAAPEQPKAAEALEDNQVPLAGLQTPDTAQVQSANNWMIVVWILLGAAAGSIFPLIIIKRRKKEETESKKAE